MADFRHVTKCRGGSGGDLPSFRSATSCRSWCISRFRNPKECHLYFAQGCHLNFAFTGYWRITTLLHGYANPLKRLDTSESVNLHKCLILLNSCRIYATRWLRAPISISGSNSYAGSSSQILTDPTGERRSRRFRQHFRGFRSYRPNPSGESGHNAPAPQTSTLSAFFSASLADRQFRATVAAFWLRHAWLRVTART